MPRYSLLLLFLSFFTTQAKEIVVCNTCEVTSIQAAVDMATDGDVIRIKSGTYKEYDIKVVNKSISIVGEDFPVIDAEMKGTVFSIQADDFTIEGLNIINVSSSHTKDFAAILMAHSKNFTIKNNRLDNIFFGILLEKSTGGKVIGNTVKGNNKKQDNSGNGIHLWYSKEVEIRDNFVSGMRDGIYLEFAGNCTITNNTARNNLRYGLHFMFSDHNEYIENIFESNGAGVAVMFSKHIKMYRNQFRKSWGSASYGLLLKEITDAELRNNVFENNTIAISADGTNRMIYTENDFRNNGYAVKVRGACYNNNFSRNNFLYNSFDISYTGRLNENEFHNNYWTEYSGYDLNRDGVGDVPHRPVKLFSYLVNNSPEAIILLRSIFIDVLNFSEKVTPIFTPKDLIDHNPQMKKIVW